MGNRYPNQGQISGIFMPSNDPVPASSRCAARTSNASRATDAFAEGSPALFEALLAWLGRRSVGARMGLVVAASVLLWSGIILAIRAALPE